jgi:MHS family proline/betaine transporter-like MFS transporter
MTMADARPGAAQPATVRTVAAGMIGNTLEWYDFSIYGYFAVSIGAAFFPKADAVAQVLAAFGVFAVGYVMRPLGGAVMGYIGDRFGRKIALTLSIGAMVVPTFLVGLLPGYATLGLAAPIILTFLRVFQGVAIGGEFTTAMVFLVERAPPGRRGVLGAMGCVGASLGCLLGSGTGAVLAELLPADMMAAWGWRIPFLLGLVLGVAGVFLRRHIHEAPMARIARPSLARMLREHFPLLARFAGMAAFFAVSYYLMFLYVVSWLQTVDGVAPARSLEVTTAAEAGLIPVTLFMGWLSDRIGRKPILVACVVLGIVGSMPLLWLMHHPDPLFIGLGQAGFVIIVGMVSGVIPSALVEAAPYHVRCTVVALGYNTALGVIGGLTPLAAEWLIHRTDNDLSPAWMLMGAAALSLVATLFQPETHRDRLQTSSATA